MKLYRKQLTTFKKSWPISYVWPNTSPTPDEGVKSLQLLSDGFDDFNVFQKEERMELKQISVELVKLTTKVDAIGKAID